MNKIPKRHRRHTRRASNKSTLQLVNRQHKTRLWTILRTFLAFPLFTIYVAIYLFHEIWMKMTSKTPRHIPIKDVWKVRGTHFRA